MLERLKSVCKCLLIFTYRNLRSAVLYVMNTSGSLDELCPALRAGDLNLSMATRDADFLPAGRTIINLVPVLSAITDFSI